MYGVIICPRCGRARGADLSVKTSKCPACGSQTDISRAKVLFQTDDESELAEAVRSASVRMPRSIEEYDEEVVEARQAIDEQRRRTKNASFDIDAVGIIARELSSLGDFSIEDLGRALLESGYDLDAVKIMQIMLDQGLVFEPKAGSFRSL